MGIHTSAILLYGIPVPSGHTVAAYGNEQYLDAVLHDHEGVGHASAGPYDDDTRYLCTDYYEAEIRRYGADPVVFFPHFNDIGRAERNARLEHAAMDLKIEDQPEPAWYLIADQN